MSEATQQQSIASCPYCQKSGLPILPLRYAVTRTDSGSGLPSGPELSGSFGEGVTDIALPEGQSYTLRLVRAGYLYVFNEMRGSWSGYIVTERGYLFPYVSEIKHDVLVGMNPEQVQGGIDALLEPPTEDEEFTCTSNPNHHYPGRCITIPDADQADNIYLAFSDTAWTKRVWKEHATNAPVGDGGPRRRDRMRKVSLAEWRSGGSAEHSAPIAELSTHVAEADYPWISPNQARPDSESEQVNSPATPFSHSPAEVNGLDEQAEGLVTWAETQAEALDLPPLMVAVDDPVGITAEIAGIMGVRREEFMRQDHLHRPLTISAVIDSLQESVRNQAELRYIKERENQMIRTMTTPSYYGPARGPVNVEVQAEREEHYRKLENDRAYRESIEEDARRMVGDHISADDIQGAGDSAWRKYQRQLAEGQPDSWKEKVYQKELTKYDRKYIIPLAEAHKSWLKNEVTWKAFCCNHDDADGDSGAGYIQALLLCIQDTQQIQACFDTYEEWLAADELDNENILQRALTHNQKALLDAFNGVDLSTPDVPYDKWTALIGLYNESLKHVSSKGKNLVAHLIVAVGGPVMKVLDTMIDQGIGRLVISLGVIGRAPISVVQHTGTVSGALDVMVRMMKELNPDALGDIDSGLLKRRLEIQTRGQRRQISLGSDEQGRPVQQVRMRVSRFELKQINGDNLEAGRLARLAANSALEMDEWPANQMARFRTMFDTNARLAVIGLILQAFATHQLSAKLDESMPHQRTENTWRYRASWTAMLGGIGGVIHDGVMAGVRSGTIRLGRMASNAWIKWAGKLSRGLGIVGASIMAVFDLRNMVVSASRGDFGMASLHLAMSVTGFGATLLFTSWGASLLGLSVAAATGIGIVLIVVGIGVSILVDYLKNNSLQEWMERCFFGELSDDRYGDLKSELGQLEVALNSLGVKPGEREVGSTSAALSD